MAASDLLANRRKFLAHSVAATIVLPVAAIADPLRRTPPQVLGPYYPVAKAFPTTHDLTHPPGGRSRARGELIHVSGRVLNRDGRPVPHAHIEIWQANAAGRYDHPSDNSGLPLDPNFQGLATFEADGEGRYAFLTIKPGKYPSVRGLRAPHIHYEVTGRVDRLVTQVYFPGDALNAVDPFLKNEPRPEDLTMRFAGSPTGSDAATDAVFDLVLGAG